MNTALRGAIALGVAAAAGLGLALPASAAGPDQVYVRTLSTDDPGGRVPWLGSLATGDVPLFCDLDGDGGSVLGDVVAWNDGDWLVAPDTDRSRSFSFGRPDDEPLCGDWDGDGRDEPGVKRGNRYLLAGDGTGKGPVTSFTYGRASDVAMAGDWDGDGDDTIAVKRGNTYYAARANVAGGGGSVSSTWGRATDAAIPGASGMLSGRGGHDSLVLRRGQTYIVTHDRIGSRLGQAASFRWGRTTDLPLATGTGSVGLLRYVP